jgi:hypothetical protein
LLPYGLFLDLDTDPLDPVHFRSARVQFSAYFYGGWNPGWAQDYPRAERNLLKILAEVTGIETTPESYEIVQLEDPKLLEYPFLYFSEPRTWNITPETARNFRKYLERRGFATFDDFDSTRDWINFEHCMKQVIPERNLVELTLGHPVFHCFYEIEILDMEAPYRVRGKPPSTAWRMTRVVFRWSSTSIMTSTTPRSGQTRTGIPSISPIRPINSA